MVFHEERTKCWCVQEVLCNCVLISAENLAAMRGDDAEVSWDPVSSFHLHQVSCHHLLSIDLHLFSLSDYKGLLEWQIQKLLIWKCVMADWQHIYRQNTA